MVEEADTRFVIKIWSSSGISSNYRLSSRI